MAIAAIGMLFWRVTEIQSQLDEPKKRQPVFLSQRKNFLCEHVPGDRDPYWIYAMEDLLAKSHPFGVGTSGGSARHYGRA